MKKKRKENSNKMLDDYEHDPLEGPLDVEDLEIVGVGPGWSQVPKRLRSFKHLREARVWLARKSRANTKRRRAA